MVDSGKGAGGTRDAGGLMRHIPVMLHEVVECLDPASGETIIDGTFGAGGYTRAVLEKGAAVIAIDRDPDAIASGRAWSHRFGDRLMLIEAPFSTLDQVARNLGRDAVDGVVLDIGVSSMQLDEAERGFSFQKDGPLDMRMAQSGVSAADIINRADASTLTRIFGLLGEERHAGRVARAIINARGATPFTSTLQLADLIEKTLGRKPGDRIHPATRSFQGLRIFVNRELDELAEALFAAERILAPGGRLVVVTFHSLEDRIVKRFFQDRAATQAGSRHLPDVAREAAVFEQPKRQAISPSTGEAEANPRARSAKLRFGIRTDAAVRAADKSIFKLPKFSS